MDIPTELAMEIEKLAAMGPAERLEQGERAKGFEIVHPGSVSWLPVEDWTPSTIISTDGRRVRLVALLASDPGHGGLRRLVEGIIAAGLEPVVVEPFPQLVTTLERWGWRSRRIGYGFDAHEIWYPRPRKKARC